MTIEICSAKISNELNEKLNKLYAKDEAIRELANERFNFQSVAQMAKEIDRIKKNFPNPQDFKRETRKLLDEYSVERINDRLNKVESQILVNRLMKSLESSDMKLKNGKTDYKTALYKVLTGSKKNIEGANYSVQSVMDANNSRYTNFILELFDEHDSKILSDPKTGRELMSQMEDILEMGFETAKKVYGEKGDYLIEIAKKYRKAQDFMYNEKVRAGYKVQYKENYVERSYDAEKIMVNPDEALEDLKNSINYKETFPNKTKEEADKILKETIDNIVKGNADRLNMDIDLLESTGRTSLEARLTKSRKFVFNEGATSKWNAKWGKGDPMQNLITQFKTAAKQNALREVLGANPKSNYMNFAQKLIDHATAAKDVDAVNMIMRNVKELDLRETPKTLESFKEFLSLNPSVAAIWKNLDGTATRSANKGVSNAMGALRAWHYTTTLGKSMITALTDLPAAAGALSATTGKNYITSAASVFIENITSTYPELARAIVTGNVSPKMRAKLKALNVHIEIGQGAIMQFLGVDETVTGRGMAKLAEAFTRINPIGMQAAMHKASLLSLFGDQLSKQLDSGKLEWSLQASLKRAGLTDEYHDVLKDLSMEIADGVRVLSSENAANVKPEKLQVLREKLGKKDSKFLKMDDTKLLDHVTRKVDVMFVEIGNNGIPTPSLKQKALMNQGISAGTIGGELLRTVGMLKSFPIKMNEVVGSIYHARGGGLKGAMAVSAYASGLTAMGAMSLTIKDALENRTPRDFSKPENMLEAISQGGAWALYGDLIVQALTNENSDFSKGQLGPVVGTVEDTFNLATKTVHSVFGDSKKGLKAKDMNKLINKVPFNNHFMLRPAMNALFLEDFMNASDPKRARRIRKMMRERGQSPIFE